MMRCLLMLAALAAPARAQPRCDDATTLPQPCTHDRYVRIGRIALEAVMGAALGAVPEVTGAYVGLSIDLAAGHEAGAGLDIGTALGASLGVGSSVYLAGHLMDGDGAFGWSVLGSTAGTGLAAGLLALKSTTGTLVIAATLPIAGAIAGYELSSHDRRSRVAIVPTIGKSSIGIAGSF